MVKRVHRVLAIGSHPDDIEIGCGGTLAKLAYYQNADVYIMVLTQGESGGNLQLRVQEQEAAAAILGVKRIYWGDYDDTMIPINQQIIVDIEQVINEVKPDLIITHYRDDTHQDHRNLSNATITAARNTRNVLFYEGPTSFNFSPSVYVDIEDTIEKKRIALIAHKSQVDKTNIEGRNILQIADANAIFRGVEGRVKYAEGFIPLRLFI
jgi:LmbE family N-acetylglucosaminyl deacetylase